MLLTRLLSALDAWLAERAQMTGASHSVTPFVANVSFEWR